MFSTSGDGQYIGGVQYIGGCSVHQGVFSTSGDTMSTSGAYHEYNGGDIMSTSGDVLVVEHVSSLLVYVSPLILYK